MKNSYKIYLFIIMTHSMSWCGSLYINQCGYLPAEQKYFYTDVYADSFEVIEKSSGVVYYKNEVTNSVQNDPATGLNLFKGDFSSFERTGEYYIKTAAGDTSFTFSVSQFVFSKLFESSLKAFYFQRCGTELSGNEAGIYAHAICHQNDGVFHSSTGQTGMSDKKGGWHDAGDYGKYIVNAGISAGTLLMAYEYFPVKFTADNLNIPESGNGVPDILDEVKYELEWFLKMQDLEGGVFFKVTKEQFEGFIMPQQDGGSRYVYQISSTATADFAAVMARAARVFTLYDSNFANSCSTAALKAWIYLTAHPSIVPAGGFTNPPGTHTGQYGDANDTDERLWAAAELFELTGENEFHSYFIANAGNNGMINSTMNWNNVKNLALITYLRSKRVNASTILKNQIRSSLLNYCNNLVNKSLLNGFDVSISPGEYTWGSNSTVLNNGILLVYAYEESNDSNYRFASLKQLNYITGINAHRLSFVTGIGKRSVLHPHHRPSGADGIAPPVPGLVAGGPDQYLSDPTLQLHFNSSTPPALCYIDDINSYASNEIAINWNAPLVFISGYFNYNITSEVETGKTDSRTDDILLQVYPNPFNSSTKIKFRVPASQNTRALLLDLTMYDILGKEVVVLMREAKSAGEYEVNLNYNHLFGGELTSGVYFLKLNYGSVTASQKIVYVK